MTMQHFLEGARRAWMVVNPFYRNPVVVMPTPEHLDDTHYILDNPHLAIYKIQSLLANHRDVIDAMREFDGQYFLIASIVQGDHDIELRVNIYGFDPMRIADETVRQERLTTSNWEKMGRYNFILEVYPGSMMMRGRNAVIRPYIQPKLVGYYSPDDVIQSWTIPLSLEQQKTFGLAI
jgi:hypothetical protein